MHTVSKNVLVLLLFRVNENRGNPQADGIAIDR